MEFLCGDRDWNGRIITLLHQAYPTLRLIDHWGKDGGGLEWYRDDQLDDMFVLSLMG